MSIVPFARTLRLFFCSFALGIWAGVAVVAQETKAEPDSPAAPREIEFRGGIENWAIGADGTRLALRDLKTSEIVVIDVSRGETLCRSTPVFVGQACKMAADADAVYLLSTNSQQLIALRLDDGSEIARAELDYKGLDAVEVAAGAAARGPIALYVSPENPEPTDADYHGVQFLDRTTLRPDRGEPPYRQAEELAHALGSASNDGSTFAFSNANSRFLIWRNGGEWLQARVFADGRPLLSEDGRVLMMDRVHAGGYFRPAESRDDFPPSLPDIKAFPVGEKSSLLRTFGFDLPLQAHVRNVRGGNSLRLAFADSSESLEPVGVCDFLSESERRPEGTASKSWIERIFYSHEAKAVAAISLSNRRVIWFRYDLGDAIANASEPMVKILTSAFPTARVGEKWEVKLDVVASGGAPSFGLENAPAGMTIDGDGTMAWTPVQRSGRGEASVTVVASLEGSQRSERTYRLVVEPGEALEPLPSDLSELPLGDGGVRLSFASPGGEILVLSGQDVAPLGPDGHSVGRTTRLPATYDLVGKRGRYYVAANVRSRTIDVVDAVSGEMMRSAKFDGTKVIELAMHPTKSVACLSYFENPGTESASFLVFDEERARVVQSPDKWHGERISFSPDGTRLATTRLELPESAKGSSQPGGSSPPPPGAPFRGFGVPPKGRPFTYLYDTFDPLDPIEREKREFAVLSDAPKAPAVSWQPDGSLIALTRFDAIIFHDGRNLTPAGRQLAAPHGKGRRGGETLVAWHPRFRLAAGFVQGAFVAAATDPKLDPDFAQRIIGSLPSEAESGSAEQVWFSRDGRNLIFLYRKDDAVDVRISPLHLPEELDELLSSSEGLEGAKQSAVVPLKDLDALRGGSGEAMSVRTIAEKFDDAVAVVECGDSRGTAFVVGSRGYALTCAHVVDSDKPVRLVFLDPRRPTEDSKTVGAEVLDRDEEKDLAFLRFDPPHEMTPVRLSRDERCSLGEPAVAIGNPGLGESVLERTVTTGVVSSTGRRIGTFPLLQVSAQVNPGSSGGPVFDERGRVIGMVTLKARIEGAGFATPAPELTRFLLKNASFDGESIQLEREWGERGRDRTVTAKLISLDDERTSIQTASGKTYALPHARLNEGDSLFLSELAKIRKGRDAESDP